MESVGKILIYIVLLVGVAVAHEGFERTVEGPQRRSLCSLTCQLTPDQEQGPFYSNTTLYRQNITEDRPGIFALYIYKIIDIGTCEPIENVAVDMWQCDALGVYSAYTESDNEAPVGSTYLRGIQLTNASGIATFSAIYPGFYSGLDTHTHVKVRLNGNQANSTSYVGGTTVHIGRVFYNDTITDIIQTANPYVTNTDHGTRVLLNADRVYLTQNGSDSMATVVSIDGSNYLNGVYVYITLGVDTTADASSDEVTNTGGATGGPAGASGGASEPPSSSTGSGATSQAASLTSSTTGSEVASTSWAAVCSASYLLLPVVLAALL